MTFIEYVFGLVREKDPWPGSPKTGLSVANRTGDLLITCENTVPSTGQHGLDGYR